LLAISIFVLQLNADEWNKKTIITANQPIEIPGDMILPAGKYALRLMDSPSNRHIVQFWSSDETKLYNTVLAIPNWRSEPTDDPLITFYESETGQAPALRAWYYAGSNNGVDFLYPKDHLVRSASTTGETAPSAEQTVPLDRSDVDQREDEEIVAARAPRKESSTGKSDPELEPVEEGVELAQGTPPSTPLQTRRDPDATEVSGPPAVLPQTSSPQALLLLLGLGSAVAAFGLKRTRL
jgi:hypothetical protein